MPLNTSQGVVVKSTRELRLTWHHTLRRISIATTVPKDLVSIQSLLLKAQSLWSCAHPVSLACGVGRMKWLNHVVLKQGQYLGCSPQECFPCFRGHMTEWIRSESLPSSSKKILALLRANPELSAREMAKTLHISARAVKKHLAALRQKGKLRRIGPARGGRWELL